MRLRDTKSKAIVERRIDEWSSEYDEQAEIQPTIRELLPLNEKLVAEFGCGTGRFTLKICQDALSVIAIDFSMDSLRVLAKKARNERNIGLVQADITKLCLAPRAFDRILSTLHSNLPTRRHRMASNRLASKILTTDGRYVCSMHYHGLWDWVLRVPRSGYYHQDNSIYRYHMRTYEAKQETLPYFSTIFFSPIKVSIPGIPYSFLSKTVKKIWIVKEMAKLLLSIAEHPKEAE